MSDCKCKDCKNRYLGCHSSCPDYQEFLKRNEKKKEQRNKEQLKERLAWWGWKK